MKIYKSILLACAIGITSFSTAHAQEAAAPADSQVQRLLAELMMNVDLSLMMRIQQTLSNNMALIASHSKTYYGCLRTEGVLAEGQTPNLEDLIQSIKAKGQGCNYILQSFFDQVNTDITQEEFKSGLSPKYQELLQI